MSSKTDKIDTVGATGFAVLLGLAALSYGAWRMNLGSGSYEGGSALPGFLMVSTESVGNSADAGSAVALPVSQPDTIALLNAEQNAIESEAEIKRLNDRLRAAEAAKPPVVEREPVLALSQVNQPPPSVDLVETIVEEVVIIEQEPMDNRQDLIEQHDEIVLALASEHADEIAKIEAQLASSRKQAEVDSVALSKAEAEISGLQRQMEAAKATAPVVAVNPVAETEVDAARSGLAQDSQALLARLDAIGDDPAKLRALYDGDPEQGGARPATSVQFGVGSDVVSAAKRNELRAIAEGVDEGTRFLVVGYASTDGSAASNAALSNKRAESVARELAAIVSPSDRVEAIYYGQTKRFSSKRLSPNRVVEVWAIR